MSQRLPSHTEGLIKIQDFRCLTASERKAKVLQNLTQVYKVLRRRGVVNPIDRPVQGLRKSLCCAKIGSEHAFFYEPGRTVTFPVTNSFDRAVVS
mgnify:CR=1 FL=1